MKHDFVSLTFKEVLWPKQYNATSAVYMVMVMVPVNVNTGSPSLPIHNSMSMSERVYLNKKRKEGDVLGEGLERASSHEAST